MFKKGELMVEGLDQQPLDAPNSNPNWEEPLRCYSPVMYEAEVRADCLALSLHLSMHMSSPRMHALLLAAQWQQQSQ